MRTGLSFLSSIVLLVSASSLTSSFASPIPISNFTQGKSWTRQPNGSWQAHAGPVGPAMSTPPLVAVYDNTTNSQAAAYVQGPAAGVAPTITRLVADDLTLNAATYIGADIREITFSIFNGNALSISLRPLLRFYQIDGAGGNPGTLMNGFDLNPIAVPANTAVLLSFDPGAGALTVPLNQKMWAGVTFDNLGGTATAAQMNNVGQALFDPPTVGSSADLAFETTAAGSFMFDNPPGAQFSLPLLPPTFRANFAVKMQVVDQTQVPEPGMGICALVGGCTLLTRGRRRVRKFPHRLLTTDDVRVDRYTSSDVERRCQ